MPTTSPKPIQTRYKGYNFRSRLEARYAVFLDALGLRWEYELEGFQLPSGWYLPDFKVQMPQLLPGHFWLEIKPATPDWHDENGKCSIEIVLARQLCRQSMSTLLFGTPDSFDDVLTEHQRAIDFESDYPEFSGYAQNEARLSWKAFTPQFWGRPSVIDQQAGSDVSFQSNPTEFLSLPALRVAATAARSARFEHGEYGAT